MPKRAAKGTGITSNTQKVVDALKIIGGEHRLRILHVLRDGPKSVTEIEWLLGLRQPRISQELSMLRKGNLVQDKNKGRNRIYSLHQEKIREVVELLSSLVE